MNETEQKLREFVNKNIEYMPKEASVVRKVWSALKAAGTPVVAVFDGETTTPARTRDAVMQLVFNLDEAYLMTASNSWVRITLGNEWDCLTDYTTDLEDALGPVVDWIMEKD